MKGIPRNFIATKDFSLLLHHKTKHRHRHSRRKLQYHEGFFFLKNLQI